MVALPISPSLPGVSPKATRNVIQGYQQPPFVCKIWHLNVNFVSPVPLVAAAPLVLSPVHMSGSHNCVDSVVVLVV